MPSKLQKELKQSKPFESLETETALNLTRTQAVLQRPVENLLREYGLTAVLYNVLRIVRGAGPDGIPCSRIGERMLTRVPDVTRLVDRLVAAGLVHRRRTEEDRRLVLLTLSAKGEEILAQLDAPIVDVHKEALGHLSAQELERLNTLLVKARKQGSG